MHGSFYPKFMKMELTSISRKYIAVDEVVVDSSL